MDTMDFKDIAWVGNIYQKFEAMCLEVEETMCQETAKYVENQVKTVGATMKRFCSDVMQDLLPPSPKDLSKVASADLLLNPYIEFGTHKNPKSDIKEDAKNPICIKEISENKSKPSNDVWEDWSAPSFNWDISDNDEANIDQMAMEEPNKGIECELREEQEGQKCNMTSDASVVSPVSGKTLLTKSSEKKGKRSRLVSSSNKISAERTDTCGNSVEGDVSHIGSQPSSNTVSGQSAEGDVSHIDSCANSGSVSLSQIGSQASSNTPGGQSADREVFSSQTGMLGDYNTDLTEEQESSSTFEETCVLVDKDDLHPIINHEEPSYKISGAHVDQRSILQKKIQGAFPLKKKSTRKQEYKQLASQFGNIDAESNINGIEPLVTLPTHDTDESEWELL